MTNYIYEYYQKIEDGTIVVGEYIRLVYEHIIKGLEDKLFFYDAKKADRVIRFIENFVHHAKGKLAPGLVKLELWQKAMISCIFGILDEKGSRQFREVFIVVGRKCGKSLLASGIMEYMAYADQEYGAELLCLAPKIDQAAFVFDAFWQSVQKEPELLEMTQSRKADKFIPETNTSVKTIAFSDKRSDGYNPHFVSCDEIAAWPGDSGIKQYEVMTSAAGAREQPLILSITTANYISDGIYDRLFERATRVLKGGSKEKRLLPFIYQIDDQTKWHDINELQKSLPNLGVSVSVDYILNEIAKAEQSIADRREFLCKFCNLKQNSSQAWLSAEVIESMCGEELKLDDFRESYCVAGIDLSQTTDLTAVAIVIEKEGDLYVFAKFWLPANKIEEASVRDGLPYDIYLKRGLIEQSGENFVDYKDVYNYLVDLVENYKILPLKVGYDRYSSQYLVQDLKDYGFHCDDVHQGENLYPVLMDMEGLFKDGRVHIGNNDILKVHLFNAAIKMSVERGRGKLVKISPQDHIDGVAALADAFTVKHKWHSEIGEQLKNNRG